MKTIVIAGGTGFLGTALASHFANLDMQVIILTRGASGQRGNVRYVTWDANSMGDWTATLEGAEAVINLNGKSVDCRYTETNKSLIYATRLNATAVLGRAIQQCINPPRVWINSSSATIYRHSLDKEMDEETGEIGSGFSVDVCQKWEQVFNRIETPRTRKVIIRTAIVLGKRGGALQPLKALAKIGMGGKQGAGNQYFSWLHEKDFVNIIALILKDEKIAGVYNLAAPNPVPNRDIMKALRHAFQIPFGLPLPGWLIRLGAFMIQTEPELLLKSRRVVPKKLLDEGYRFQFDTVEKALRDLAAR
jgi:uncharacterized protein